MPLTDISKLNIFLGETDITTAKTQAVKWAIGSIEWYCDREFEQSTRSEWMRVKNERGMTRSYPITPGTNAIVRMPEYSIALTLDTGYGGAVSQRDLKTNKDSITLDNNGTVTTLLFSDYANITALVAAINLTSGWSARVIGVYSSLAHLAPVSLSIVGGSEITLFGPGQMIMNYEVDQPSGIIREVDNYTCLPYVHVKYTAGLDTIPATLEMIATQMAASALKMKPENPGMKSESFGDYSYTKAETTELLSPYMKILDQWRRPSL
jgi:hypothetical protein